MAIYSQCVRQLSGSNYRSSHAAPQCIDQRLTRFSISQQVTNKPAAEPPASVFHNTHTHTHSQTKHVCKHTPIHMHTHIYYTRASTSTHAGKHAHTITHTHAHTYTHAHIHTHTHIHTHSYTHTHKHNNTHTCWYVSSISPASRSSPFPSTSPSSPILTPLSLPPPPLPPYTCLLCFSTSARKELLQLCVCARVQVRVCVP
jgi:hypothetical protein